MTGEEPLEEVLRPFFVSAADVGMPAVDEVELDGNLVSGAHGEVGLVVKDPRERLARVQGPAAVRSIVHVENGPDIIREDDVDVEATCDAN